VTITPAVTHVMPGGRLLAMLSVQNLDDVGRTCSVVIAGLPCSWYDLETSQVELAPAATARLRLAIHPLAAPMVQRGLYRASVEVTTDEDPSLRASDTLEVMVGDGAPLDLSLSPPRVRGRAAVFDVTVRNRMAWPTPVNLDVTMHSSMAWPAPVGLEVSDAAEALMFEVRPHHVMMLQPEEAGTVRVRAVSTSRRLKDMYHDFEVTVAARLPGQREGQAVAERHVRLTDARGDRASRRAAKLLRRRRWVLLATSLLVLALLAGVAWRLLASRGHSVARPAISAGAGRPPHTQSQVAPPDPLVNPTRVDLSRGPSTALIHIVNRGVRPLHIVTSR
jgi:hypothetical protein